MKKIKFLIIIVLFLIIKLNVNALTVNSIANMYLNCPSTAHSGDIIICTINLTIYEKELIANKIDADYVFNNVSFQKIELSDELNNKYNSNGLNIESKNGISSKKLADLFVLIEGRSNDYATVGLENIVITDNENNKITLNNINSKINVIEKTIPTTKTNKTLYLNNLSIDGYDINFNKNTFNYEVDVNYGVNSINILAESDDNYTISGTGLIHINEGNNTINIKVSDNKGNSTTYTIIVNKEVKTSNIVNNNIEEIKNAFRTNKELIINLNKNKDDLVLRNDIIKLIENTKRKLIYNILENDKILYSYEFDGKSIDSFNNDINLNIDFKNNDTNSIIFRTDYSDYFPKGTILKIKNNFKKNNKLKLYRVNNDKQELINNNLSLDNDFIILNIEKGDNYSINNKLLKKDLYIIIIIISLIFIISIILISTRIYRKKKQVKAPNISNYINNSIDNK